MMTTDHGESVAAPSPWVARFAPAVPAGGAVLDLACGGGRHGRMFLRRGHPVTLLDRDISGVSDLTARAEIVEADLEGGAPFPLAGRRFAGVVVANYLHRPILPAIVDAVADGGVLIYETFMAGNEAFGRPRRPDFLLGEDELLDIARDRLSVVAFEQGYVAAPRPAMVQRLCARRGTALREFPL